MTLSECFINNGLLKYLSPEKEEKLTALCGYLIEYNKKVNLTSLTEPDDIYSKHIADSAMLLPYLTGCKTLLDVGCGGGFPSLPIAILDGDISVTAMDSTKKKLDFVLYAKERLGLDNITVLHGRAEELCTGNMRQSFDAVTARAVASLPVLCELCIPYVKQNGVFLAMKTDEKELYTAINAAEKTGAHHKETVSYRLICADQTAGRSIIIFKKFKNTPPEYPRKYSIIKSRTL